MRKERPTREELLKQYPADVVDKIERIWELWPQIKATGGRRGPRDKGPEELKVEAPLAAKLKSMKHEVRRQVKCAGGRIDIVDFTAGDLIECKADGHLQSIVDAAKQLKSYQPSYPRMRLCIAVPFIDPTAAWMAESLRNSGFHFIEVEAML